MPSQSLAGRKRKSGMAARDTHECTIMSEVINLEHHVVSCDEKNKEKTFSNICSFSPQLSVEFHMNKFQNLAIGVI